MWVMESATEEIRSRISTLGDSIGHEEKRVAELREETDKTLALVQQMKHVRDQYKALVPEGESA